MIVAAAGKLKLSGYFRDEQRSLKIAIVITAGITLLEIVGGLLSNSIALFSDAWHMFTDTSALALCFVASKVIPIPPTKEKTFGYFRVDVLSALINGITLIAVVSFIFIQSIDRIISPSEVKSSEMLVVSAIGLFANLASMTILQKSMLSLNVESAFLHVLNDTLSSIGVIAAGIVIFFTRLYIVDALMGIIIGITIVYNTTKMLRHVLRVLLEAAPPSIDFDEVVEELKGVEGVKDVHDLHMWSITSYIHYLTAHIVVSRDSIEEVNKILNEAKNLIQRKYGVRNTTFQVEVEGYKEIGEVHR